MNKILITGASGFVASHFLDYLYDNSIKCEVLGVDMSEPKYDYLVYSERFGIRFCQLDLMDKKNLRKEIIRFMPDQVLHLAAFSSVAYSWQYPSESFQNNCNIFLNLIEVIKEIVPNCRILSVGSSEEYGNVKQEDLPLREDQQVNPVSPYAVARVSQELLSKVYVNAYGMKIILTRSFNHIGPRQDDRFVVPSFINRILNIKKAGKKEGVIETGNTSIIRDFVDVRDVVKAYYILLNKGKIGEIYNVCSGKGISLSKIIDYIADEVGVRVIPEINPKYIRPDDNAGIVGSPLKMKKEFGWIAECDVRNTIRDMVNERLAKCNANSTI